MIKYKDVHKLNKKIREWKNLLLNRNDKCYCGSGKKYKNCCMEKDIERGRAERKIKMVEEAQLKYLETYSKITNFGKEERFAEYRKSAEDIFYIINSETVKNKFEKLFNTFFISDCLLEGSKTLTQVYAAENKSTDKELRVMNSLINSYISVYTVEKKENDKAILKDCILDETVTVDDIKVLKDITEGDSMIARLIEVNGLRIFIDVALKIDNASKEIIVEDMNNIYENNKKDWPNEKIFLAYNTYQFYKYLQQILDEEVASYIMEKLKSRTEEVANNDVEDNGSVASIISRIADEDCKEKCLEFWKEYEASHEDIKGSESGWAAAVEYVIKKENGISATQQQISEKYKISPSTIGKRAKELKA